MGAQLTAAADSVLRDIVAGAPSMDSGLAVAVRIAAREQAQRIDKTITAAIERGVDYVDLPMDGGKAGPGGHR